ncbi:MAG: PD-(D/E)XK nuclease family transposase [Candidatus Riflebacteria bacterium]|nr:PD-(D/E)XK nuclease family transposase [Candidatus Riflebacteria bacterium]
MVEPRAKYLNPFTDFGFKKLFGEEYNKDLLIDFLNQLLKNKQGKIKKLTYLKNEQIGRSEYDRRAVFDLYCESEPGEKFIVEMQKTKQKFFKDRSVYYSTFPIAQQAITGGWNFELKAVYTVAVLDFIFDEDEKEPEKFRYDVKLSDIETNKVFYDKLTFIYLEMPKFNRTIDQLNTRFEKWLYVLKNLERFHKIPEKFQDCLFKKLFSAAEIAHFTLEEAMLYEDSLKIYRDLNNSLDTAREEGREKGREEGREEGRKEAREGLVTAIIAILEARFKKVPEEISSMIQPLKDLELLKNLSTKAATLNSLEAFRDFTKTQLKYASGLSEKTSSGNFVSESPFGYSRKKSTHSSGGPGRRK